MESPLRLTAHGGFGEGNEETRPSRGGKVRFVSTLLGGWGAVTPPGYPTSRPGKPGEILGEGQVSRAFPAAQLLRYAAVERHQNTRTELKESGDSLRDEY